MNTYSGNILKQFTVKRGLLHYITGPLNKRPAGHIRPNGQRYVRFDGAVYKHDDLLFLYNEQLNSKSLEQIDIKGQYQTISGYPATFYNNTETAEPYVIHGAISIKDRWHPCQWTAKGEALQPEYNLEKTKKR